MLVNIPEARLVHDVGRLGCRAVDHCLDRDVVAHFHCPYAVAAGIDKGVGRDRVRLLELIGTVHRDGGGIDRGNLADLDVDGLIAVPVAPHEFTVKDTAPWSGQAARPGRAARSETMASKSLSRPGRGCRAAGCGRCGSRGWTRARAAFGGGNTYAHKDQDARREGGDDQRPDGPPAPGGGCGAGIRIGTDASHRGCARRACLRRLRGKRRSKGEIILRR